MRLTIHLTSRSLLQPLFLSIGWCLKSKVQFHYSHMCIAGSPCIWICYCWKVGINTWSLPDFERELICKALLVIDSNRDSVHIFLWRFLGFSVRPFAGFPGYSYLPNPTAAAAAATPVTPTASGPERVSAYYDYSAAAHQQQQQPQATPRPEHTVNNSRTLLYIALQTTPRNVSKVARLHHRELIGISKWCYVRKCTLLVEKIMGSKLMLQVRHRAVIVPLLSFVCVRASYHKRLSNKQVLFVV